MSGQPDLFGEKPRRPRRWLMHAIDAGPLPGGNGIQQIARFACNRCDAETDWLPIATVTAVKRGIPCQHCNNTNGTNMSYAAFSPVQKIRLLIIIAARQRDADENEEVKLDDVTIDTVDEIYDELDCDTRQDLESYEVRSSGIETNISAPSSRHYESDSVAAQLPDGSWVGWTHWYGGGKHGEPEAIEWIDHAYDLDVTGQETVIKYQFAKREATAAT